MTNDIRLELLRLRREEQMRQRKKREKNMSRFVKNPFKITKEKDQGLCDQFTVERRKMRVIYTKHTPTH